MRSWSIFVLFLLLAGCVPQQQKELKLGEKAIILTGTVFPDQEAEVMSPISAIVNQILVQPGEKVKAGEILLRLDPTAVRAEVARAEAALATARTSLVEARAGASEAELAEAQAEVERLRQELRRQQTLAALPPMTTEYEQAGIILENAKAKLERMYALFAKRLVSKPEVEAAENEYAEAWRRFEASKEALERRTASGDSDVKIAEARYKAARARLAALEAGSKRGRVEAGLAQVRQAEADLARARYNLGQTTLKAPIAGIVTEVMAQVGEKVYEGRPLVKVVDIARVRVKADLSPGLLPYVQIGQKAQVTVNTVPPTNVRASVDRIQPVADPKTQSLGLTLFLPNPEFKFQPGFTARVEIPVERGPSKEPARKEGST